MLINPGVIRTWLYTSELIVEASESEIHHLVKGFRVKNQSKDVTGFMVSNGKAVMQLLEGSPSAIEPLKAKIESDTRHHKVVTEVWDLESRRAYPHWAMQAAAPSNYEDMFAAIERSAVHTIASDIARMLFDATFSE